MYIELRWLKRQIAVAFASTARFIARASFAQLLCLAGYDLLFHYYFIVCVLCGGGDSSGSNSRDGKCKMLFGDGNSTMTKNTLHIVDNKCCTILTF